MSSEETAGEIRTTVEGRILAITIANAARRNAITPDMMQQLADALTELDENPDLWAGVVSGEGDHFTAGLDMPKFFGPGATAKPIAPEKVDPLGLGKHCRKPIVTAVQGITYTVGLELMLAGDIVVAADSARFSQMEAKRGIAPLGGAHFRYLTRMGWGDAMYHLMLCDEFGADRALEIGLVQEVVPHGQQVERAMEIAHLIAANAPIGIQATKAGAHDFIAAAERTAVAALPDIRSKVMGSKDMMEGIQSFMERRPAKFEGK
jgi:enoyl-CoA hydratase/carnithine racemase